MRILFTRFVPIAVTLAALAGCGTSSRSADHAPQPAAKTDAVTAAAPNEIEELTDQKKVWECPQCGMDYDGPGQCAMDHSKLVETKVDYICPADNQPVDKAGKCPRCAVNARVVKTAIAAVAPGASPAATRN
jgi:hypothetical protein